MWYGYFMGAKADGNRLDDTSYVVYMSRRLPQSFRHTLRSQPLGCSI